MQLSCKEFIMSSLSKEWVLLTWYSSTEGHQVDTMYPTRDHGFQLQSTSPNRGEATAIETDAH